MANNIAGLPLHGTITGADLLWLEQGGLPFRLSIADLRTDMASNAGAVTLAGAQTITGVKTFQANVLAGINDFRIQGDTSVAADTRRITVAAGGDFAQSRGAALQLHGVNHASAAGAAILTAGTGGNVDITSGGGSTVINLNNRSIHRDAKFDRLTGVADTGIDLAVANGIYGLQLHGRLSAAGYNARVASGDQGLIFTNAASAASNTGALFIGPWNTGAGFGLRMTAAGAATLYGNLTISEYLSFGSVSVATPTDLSQHIRLYGTSYGISITSSTLNIVQQSTAAIQITHLPITMVSSPYEFVSTKENAFRVVSGNYGAFFRQDGTNFHLLFTASGDQYGSWNSLRPFSVALASGKVTMGNAFDATGNCIVNGAFRSAGSTAVLHFADRTLGTEYGWYGTGGVIRLYNGASDVVTIRPADGSIADTFGYLRDLPVITFNGNGNVLTSSHYGRVLMKNNSTACTWTLVPTATDAYRVGCAITFINYGNTTQNITIQPGSGVSLYRGTTNAAVTVAPGTSITILCIGANIWQVL